MLFLIIYLSVGIGVAAWLDGHDMLDAMIRWDADNENEYRVVKRLFIVAMVFLWLPALAAAAADDARER